MKVNKLLVAALAAMTLVSCNKDDSSTPEVKSERGETTLARITLTQTTPGTYAHYGNLTPTTEESTIKTANLYIFDNTRVLEKEVALSLTPGATTSTSQAFEITTGQKYFYVAININTTQLPTVLPNVTIMQEVQMALINAASITAATDASGDGFWMTSLQEVGEILVEATDAEATAGTKNNVQIHVGRAVAKVGLQYDETTAAQQSAGKLTQVKYKVHNNPVRMHLIPSYDNVSGLLKTPFYNATSIVAANYFHNPAYLDAGLDGGNQYYENPSYMMENSNQVPASGNATFLMIRGVYTPDVVYDEDGQNPRAAVEDDDFYRIKKSDGTYTDKFYFEDPTAATLATEGGVSSVLYSNGECYYGMWLKDSTKSSPECYAISRNTYFGVTITSVSGPGESSETEVTPDPDEKLDEDTYMRAEITVLNWAPVEQSGGI